MKFTKLAFLASLVATISAHTTVWGVWVNGVNQGNGQNTYVPSLVIIA